MLTSRRRSGHRHLSEESFRLNDRRLSILESAQIYQNPHPAAGCSDHASFLSLAIPACVTSEAFFADWGDPSHRNPDYHREDDLLVDLPYATSIACAIGPQRYGQQTRPSTTASVTDPSPTNEQRLPLDTRPSLTAPQSIDRSSALEEYEGHHVQARPEHRPSDWKLLYAISPPPVASHHTSNICVRPSA